MSSKRKSEEIDDKHVKKKHKTDIYSYIEGERQKMLIEKESLECIKSYVYRRLERLAFQSAELIFQRLLESDPSAPNPFVIFRGRKDDSHLYIWRNCYKKDDLVCGRNIIDSASTVTYGSLAKKIMSVMRNWNLDMYKKCIEEFNILKKANFDIWVDLLMKVFPPAMLEHCNQSDVIADFFHTFCHDMSIVQHILNDMKPSYLQFFLMNMAAANRIESSVVLGNDRWNKVKKKILEYAFRFARKEHLRLLFQYFPNDMWSKDDSQVLHVVHILKGWREDDVNKIGVTYYDDLTLYNTLLLALFSAASFRAPRDNVTECVRLFWRASETPFPTSEHFRLAFHPSRFTVYCERLRFQVCMYRFQDSLLSVYPPECVALYQPRSLMHLSRCKIRRSLTSSLEVYCLPLPSRMKAYLNLEW